LIEFVAARFRKDIMMVIANVAGAMLVATVKACAARYRKA
jgi:hypothetical protein